MSASCGGMIFRAILVLLTGACSSRAPVFDIAWPSGPELVEIPLRIEDGRPLVRATAGGRTLSLLLDTGGFDHIALRADVLDRIAAEPTGATRRWRDAEGRVHRSREHRLPELALDGLRLGGVFGHDLAAAEESFPEAADGYLGLGVLRRFVVLIDLPGERMVLGRADSDFGIHGIEDWPRSGLDLDGRGATSRLGVDDRDLLVVWDTGFDHSVVRPRAARGLPTRVDGDQRFWEPSVVRLGGREVRGFDLLLYEFRQPKVDAIVGANLFAERPVLFEFAEGSVRVGPSR